MSVEKAQLPIVPQQGHVPGELGVWVFILGDMLVFALFFATYMFYRAGDISAFRDAQLLLNQNLGALNTLLLLTSSWFLVLGVKAVRAGMLRHAWRLIALAAGCGVGFAVIKFVEYREKFSEGISVGSNDFFMYYFVFTGIHLLHVVVGIAVLAALVVHLRRIAGVNKKAACNMPLIEGGACYWHMVDLLWIVLFPLLYMVQ